MKVGLRLTLVALLILGAAWTAVQVVPAIHPPGADQPPVSAVSPAASPNGVAFAQGSDQPLSGSGVLQAQADVAISAESSGRVVFLGAQEGDEVEAGAVLVRLGDELIAAQIEQAKALVEAAQAKVTLAQASARPAEVQAAQSLVDSAKAQVGAAEAAEAAAAANLEVALARVKMAQASYARVAAGPSSNELNLATKQVELSRIQLWAAQTARDATRNGMDWPLTIPFQIEGQDLGTIVIRNPVGPQDSDLQAAEARIVEAEAAIRLAEVQQEKLQAGPRSADLALAQAEVAQAQSGVAQAQLLQEQAARAVSVAKAQQQQAEAALALVQAGPRVDEVAVARAQVVQAQSEVAILEARRDRLTLDTPLAGVVTERYVHEGEVVIAGARLFTISTLDPVVLTIFVPESQLGRVQLGQATTVSVSAFPAKQFQGNVASIASEGEFTPRNVQTAEERATVVFAVRISIPNVDRLLRPGMPAVATFD